MTIDEVDTYVQDGQVENNGIKIWRLVLTGDISLMLSFQ